MNIRRILRHWNNPHNLTHVHLARLIRQGCADVGDFSYGAPKIRFQEGGKLSIGRFCSFADEIEIFLGGNHRTDFVTTYPFHKFPIQWPSGEYIQENVYSRGSVRIGSDVWIGSGARILSGVSIGHGAVIGAGAVVRSRIPEYAVCIGNPATVTRFRFPGQIIERLIQTSWWDLPNKEILELIPLLQSTEIERLLAALERK